MKLLLNSPIWFVLLCIAIAGLGAFLLYRKDRNLTELSTLWKRILTGLRFVSIFFLVFLLLEPLIEYATTKVEKPIVVLAYDNSESMIFSKDSIQVKKELKEKLEALKTQLSSDFELTLYGFGQEVNETPSFDFSDKQTDISKFLTEIENRYYNRNLGGVILASDGIYNSGSNPLSTAKRFTNIPIYCIAVGDTTPRRDVFVDQVSHNQLAYKGNKFPVVVTIKSEQISGKQTSVQLLKGGKVLEQKLVKIEEKKPVNQILFDVEAKGSGLQKYEVRVRVVEGEFTEENNRRSFYVDVLESKQKILVLSHSPHPDVNAIKSGLESNENYEVKVSLASKFSGEIDKFSLVVGINLPSNNSEFLLSKKAGIPTLYLLGNQTDYTRFTGQENGIEIKSVNGYTEAQAHLNSTFSQFTISEELTSFISTFSPLQVPFTQKYRVSNSTEVALFQQIGPAKTEYPLLAFNKREGAKRGFFIGEGIWRWKLQDFSLNGSNELFNELITQIAQYMVSKEDKSLFRVFGETVYDESQRVKFEAEVYNESYELVNSPEVKMQLTNQDKEEFSYSFSTSGDRYTLNAGILAPGSYSYVASTVVRGKQLTRTGEFSVTELQLEQSDPVANHQLLFNISDVTGGQLLNLSTLLSVKELLKKDEKLVDVIYQEKEVDDLINLRILFFLILLLLGIEWFVRKRNGGY